LNITPDIETLDVRRKLELRNWRKRERGGAMMELMLIGPWIFFLSVGALDWGFYATSLVSVEAAARSAALYTSTSSSTAADSATACTIALGEMQKLPNVGSVCGTNPIVTATAVTGPDSAQASQVSVTYQSVSLIPIPGLLAKQLSVTRTVTLRLRT
jgi:Flp pilus assembly protein TadG